MTPLTLVTCIDPVLSHEMTHQDYDRYNNNNSNNIASFTLHPKYHQENRTGTLTFRFSVSSHGIVSLMLCLARRKGNLKTVVSISLQLQLIRLSSMILL